MDQLAEEIFNILKGANLKIVLYTAAGQKTMEPTGANRFYVINNDLMVTIRLDESRFEVLVQMGKDFDINSNRALLSSIKSATHKAMGEFTLRKFNKNIQPKDFAHQSVKESFSRAHGGIKTSYITMPEARLIIKHSKAVDEQVHGSRSRDIHSLFIENAQKQRMQFPYRYMAGAKAMTMHVNNGGTFEDARGAAILAMCEEIYHLHSFQQHVKKNGLMNESNVNVIEACQEKSRALKETMRRLHTKKGYAEFQPNEISEEGQPAAESTVDIVNKFMYNTFENTDMDTVLSTVARVVSEREGKESMTKEILARVYDMIKNGVDFKIQLDPNDPENPSNEDPVKYSGPEGAIAKLSAMLSFMAKSSKNDEAFNLLSQLSTDVHGMDRKTQQLLAKLVMFLMQKSGSSSTAPTKAESITESVISDLRRRIA
jgi:hypothetical protein